MKKTTLISTILASAIVISLTGCFNPIFSEIRKDVKPESATVSGNITAITRYTAGGEEYLVLAADDGINYKKTSEEFHGAWKTYDALPFETAHFNFQTSAHEGQQIIKIVANSDTLYLLCATYEATGWEGKSNPSGFCLWSKKISAENGIWNESGEWTKMDTSSHNYFPLVMDDDEYYYSEFNVFQTNSPIAAHRHAYICTYDSSSKIGTYYELKDLETIEEIKIPTGKVEDYNIITNTEIEDEEDYEYNVYNRVYSAAYFDGEVHFFHSVAVTTNETYSTDANVIYFGNYESLYYRPISTSTYTKTQDNTSGKFISALAVCSDSILIGCGNIVSGSGKGGMKHAALIDGIPVTINEDFDSNAMTQLSSSYYISTLLNATPERTENESALYASLTYSETNGVFDNIGLWSYYKDRGNWNRE